MDYPEIKDFIELKYSQNSEGPARLFRSFESILTAFEIQNTEVIKALDPFLEIHFYIERIQESSIIVWLLKKIMTPDYDELLVKPEIGGDVSAYLKLEQESFIESIAGSQTSRIGNRVLDQIEENAIEIAKSTGVAKSANYAPPNKLKVAESIDIFARASQILLPDELYVFPTGSGTTGIGPFRSEIDVKQLRIEMTKREVSTKEKRVMMVKIADLLGKSKWRFKYLEKTIEARISDSVWLDKFHNKQDIVTPGDSLEAEVEQIDYFDKHNKLIDSEITILEVYDVHEGRIEYSAKGKK